MNTNREPKEPTEPLASPEQNASLETYEKAVNDLEKIVSTPNLQLPDVSDKER